MTRSKRPRVPVHLAPFPEPPTATEIDAILMATDSIISFAGRAGVTLILNGSRSQKALRNGWDKLPEYGALSHLTAAAIGERIDWCIRHDWLRFEYTPDGIPLLFHTPRGWERVKKLWVTRILDWFATWQVAGTPEAVWPAMEHINHEIKHLLLETLRDQPQPELTPVLYAWFLYEVRKVRTAINNTLEAWHKPTLAHPT